MSDVQAIVDASGLVEFEVGKALYGLFMAGFIHRVGRSMAATPALPEGRIEEHRNLGIAFFKTGMLDEALREFRRVLELRSNDPMARFHLGLVYARQQKWDDALAAFTAAAAIPGAKAPVFHNLSYVLEQMQRYEDARRALEEAVRRGGGTDPRVHTSLASSVCSRAICRAPRRRSRRRENGLAIGRRRRRGITTPGSPPR